MESHELKHCPFCGQIQKPLTNEEIMMRALNEEPVYVQCLRPAQEGEIPPEWWDVLTTSDLGTHVGFMVFDDVPINLSKNGVEYFLWSRKPTDREREIAYQNVVKAQRDNAVEWIDAIRNPPKKGGIYYVLLKYDDEEGKELVEDVGIYYNGKGNPKKPYPFWQAHPAINHGFAPVNNVVYYMPCPTKPKF